jgi:lauroyl/myristoyl acyltransferase
MTTTTDPSAQDVQDAGTPPRRRGPRGKLDAYRLERRRAVRYRLAIAVTATVSWLTWITPGPVRYRIADRLGDLFFRLGPGYRRNLLENRRHLLRGASEHEIKRSARAASRTSARNFADLLIVPHLDRAKAIADDPLIEGEWRYIDEPLSRGQGVVLLTAHLGPFDTLLHILNLRGYRITSVTGRTTSRFVFDAVTWLRRYNDSQVVEASPSGVRKIIQALRRGECAAFLSDYDFFQSGGDVTFFGSPTSLPLGPVRIARDTGSAVVPMFARRIGTRNCLIICPPFVVEKTADQAADIERGLRLVAAALEHAIGQTPDQWVMFQQVWPSAPAAPGPGVPGGADRGDAPSAASGA